MSFTHPKRSFIKTTLIAAALAGIGNLAAVSMAHAAEAGTLLIWINGDKGYKGLAKVGEEFTKKTGIKVVVEHPEDAPNKFQQAAAAGKGPDIWIWPHDRIGTWIDAGLLQPLTPSKEARAAILPLAWNAFTVSGKTWGFPFEVKSDGRYDAAKTGVNNAGSQAGVNALMTLINSGAMPKGAGYAEMEAGFNQGKIAMMINGPWSWDNARKSKINFGVATIPTVAGKTATPFVGVLGAMISKASPNKDLATEFLENQMLQLNGLKTINADVPLGTPANKVLFAELKANPNIQATMESAQAGRPMPNNPEMGRFWSSMQSALENITQGRQTTKDGLDAAAKRITTAN